MPNRNANSTAVTATARASLSLQPTRLAHADRRRRLPILVVIGVITAFQLVSLPPSKADTGRFTLERADLPVLINALKTDPDLRVRIAAAKALGKVGPNETGVVAALLEVATDPLARDTLLREIVLTQLGKLGDASATPTLLAALQDDDGRVRRSALDALSSIKDPRAGAVVVDAMKAAVKDGDASNDLLSVLWADSWALPSLLAALTDREESVRLAVVQQLRIEDPRAVSALLESLKDTGPHVRREAVAALATSTDSRVLPALISAAGDKAEVVRVRAVEALGETNDPRAVPILVRRAQDSSVLVRTEALYALQRSHDSRGLPALIAALRSRGTPPELRASLSRTLGDVLPPMPPSPTRASGTSALVGALNARDLDVRTSAAIALARIGDNRGVPALTAAVEGEYYLLAADAAAALALLDDPRAVPALIRGLEGGYELRVASARALQGISDPTTIPALVGALRDANAYPPKELTREVALALLTIGTEATPALMELLSTWDGAEWAAEGLNANGDPTRVAALERLASSLVTEFVQGGPASGTAAIALRSLGPEAIPSLRQALEHAGGKQVQVRLQVVSTLRKFDDPRVLPALTPI